MIVTKISWSAPWVMAAAFSFATPAQASLTDIGNGLIYDSNADVTWIANGLYFSDTFKASGNSLGLIGTTVTAPGGSVHTVTAGDFTLIPFLNNRELASWWGATAWADNLTYQYGQTSVTGWSLPTQAESSSLWTSLGAAATFGANVGPFAYVLPKIWASDGATDTTAVYADFALSSSGSNPVFGTAPLANFSNEWAVYHGNVANLAAVPLPGAIWLFSGALAGMGIFGRRNGKVSFHNSSAV